LKSARISCVGLIEKSLRRTGSTPARFFNQPALDLHTFEACLIFGKHFWLARSARRALKSHLWVAFFIGVTLAWHGDCSPLFGSIKWGLYEIFFFVFRS
jgi:hypothetical protein